MRYARTMRFIYPIGIPAWMIKLQRGDMFVGTPAGFNISNPKVQNKEPAPELQSLKRLQFWGRLISFYDPFYKY